jgi:hypothetical protein
MACAFDFALAAFLVLGNEKQQPRGDIEYNEVSKEIREDRYYDAP